MDEDRYGELLALHRPRVIETPEEHDAMLSLAESLMDKSDSLAPEEQKLLATTVLLIEAFELSVVSPDDDDEDEEGAEPPAPHETLHRMMQSRQLELDDIVHVFGNPYVAREALEGKRRISRGQAKELGKIFGMPPKLFQSN